MRDYVDTLHDELQRRLDESAEDREHIREGIGSRVPRAEYGLLVGRVERLEGQISRLYGGLAVIAVVLAALGLLLRYLVG